MNDAEKSKLEQELKKAAPVINRLSDGPSVLPEHVRARLEAALDKKFPLAAQSASQEPAAARGTAVEQQKAEPSWLEVWRWWIGLATATAAVALIIVLSRPGPNLPPVIQVAMLDSVGSVRGTGEKPMEMLQQQWMEAKPVEFDEAGKLKKWEGDWSSASRRTVVKVVYNRDSGELRINLRVKGGPTIEKVIPAKDEPGLAKALTEAGAFIREQLQ